MSSYQNQMNQMMEPQNQVDDFDAAFDAIDERESRHAKDIPQDWEQANPYAIDQGVPHGTGYEAEMGGGGIGEGMGMGPESMGMGPIETGAPPVDELDSQQAEDVREALAMRGQQENDMSEEMQQNTMMQNAQQKAQRKQMGM